jgi:mono/diheme cytochrome c family protein
MRTIQGALVVMALSGCEPASAHVSDATLRSLEARARGRALFKEHCVLCHGESADGRGARREGLVGTPADFTNAGWRATMTPEKIFLTIRDGKPGTSMPKWPLRDEQIADLTAYVWSVKEMGP